MEVPKIIQDEGVQKWTILAGTIAALELIGEESLTETFGRALEHDKMKYVALGALALTGAHLLGVLPREVDPYYLIQDNIEKFKANRQGNR